MLKNLSIQNYALIESSEIQFEDGLTVITGETGAGKSILLGALGLLMGDKVETKYFKEADKKCVIEAVFDIDSYSLRPFFEANELDYDAECVIRKEVSPSGKSRSFINDTPVPLTVLRTLGEQLIDIHSQHQNLLIKDDRFQLSIVDAVAGNADTLAAYREQYDLHRSLSARLANLREQAETDEADKDYIISQLERLQAATLREGEQEELESEQKVLEHAEAINAVLSAALWRLQDRDEAITSALKETAGEMTKVAEYVDGIEDLVSRCSSTLAELKDIAATVEEIRDRVEVNPQRLEQVSARLDTIYTLQRKYKKGSVAELIAYQQELDERVSRFSSSNEDIALLEKEVKKAADELQRRAARLTESRTADKQRIESSIVSKLIEMGMANSQLEVSITPAKALSPSGGDQVTFMFSANKDKKLLPISEIASGGEISRVMLSLKALLSEVSALPTIILDEIDTGISGEVASKMGKVMQEMSSRMQVITITHLPQVAAKGRSHFKVYKSDEGDRITSHIRRLSTDERIEEIAHILSGEKLTEASLQTARELLN